MTEPDAIFADPRLARLYDPLEDDREDLDVYVRMVDEFGARVIVDVGCGTGELATRLVADGRRRGVAMVVSGVDPAGASLELARLKPGAEHVRWLHGTAVDAASGSRPLHDVDMVVMTGNVAQVFVTDEDWAATLAAVASMLRPGGRFVFETRDPERRAWEHWSGDARRSVDEVEGVGRVESWIDVTDVDPPLVTFDSWFRFLDTDETLVSTSTLRFRTLDELERSLAAAGLTVDEVRDAPDRPGLEFVVVARRPD
ncbi:MAG: class I SAM-dependent methyltransferase [Actinomycetota bacterium]